MTHCIIVGDSHNVLTHGTPPIVTSGSKSRIPKFSPDMFRIVPPEVGPCVGVTFVILNSLYEYERDFESVSIACVSPELPFDGLYGGSSPRLPAVDGTQYVYTASEIPPWVIVSSHLEMSFKKFGVPKKILFWADVPNTGIGGETPLVDYRQVWREMRPDIAQRFLKDKLRCVWVFS